MLSNSVKLLICLACGVFYGCRPKAEAPIQIDKESLRSARYSAFVNDSFYVQTQLPLEYNDSTAKRYPVVVVLDGNFHFPMLAASVRQYEEGGLLPPIILVGVGYKSLKEMDSLRMRDYLYPSALPSDEMKAPGGGEQFRQFISRELLPSVDSIYRTMPRTKTLLGHSLGGYFALYTLLEQSKNNTREFKNFVAASPSIWYNNFYLNQLPAQLSTLDRKDSTRLFLSVGELENPQWDIKPNRDLATKLGKVSALKVSGGSYSHLGHMDTGQLSFLKGLQKFYR